MSQIIKPHRATNAELDFVRFPVIAMPKIDGVRGCFLSDSFTGRTLKPFKNHSLTSTFSQKVLKGFDGELAAGPILSPRLCSETTSAVNTIQGPWNLDWWLFDYITPETWFTPYEQRLKILAEKVNYLKAESPLIVADSLFLVPYEIIHNTEELDAVVQRHLTEGYEGTILRDPQGFHKEGYSTAREANFLRIKEFRDAEAVITGFNAVKQNFNEAKTNALGLTERSSHKENKWETDQIGSLICIDPQSGLTITVSAGSMSHEDKTYYFHNFSEIKGKICTYKFFPKGIKNLPRFPVLKCDKSRPFLDQLRSNADL